MAVARMSNNVHQTLTYGAAGSGDLHQHTQYRNNPGFVSLHPLQRSGYVSSSSHMMPGGGTQRLNDGQPSLGDSVPASFVDMKLPPVVPIGATADFSRFTV